MSPKSPMSRDFRVRFSERTLLYHQYPIIAALLRSGISPWLIGFLFYCGDSGFIVGGMALLRPSQDLRGTLLPQAKFAQKT